MQQHGATSAHSPLKALGTTSVLATAPVTQGTALPLRVIQPRVGWEVRAGSSLGSILCSAKDTVHLIFP